MSKRRFNYYGKLLLFTMLMGSIPVIILGVFSYIRSAEAVEGHVQASNQQLLRQTQMNVERVLKIIDHNATQFIQTPLVGDSLQSRIPAEEFRFIADLQSLLIKMQTFELGIRDVILVNLTHNWSLSNSGIARYYETGTENPYQTLAELPLSSQWISEVMSDGQVSAVQLVKKLPINTRQPTGLIIVTVPVSEIEKLVNNISRTGQTFIADSNGHKFAFEKRNQGEVKAAGAMFRSAEVTVGSAMQADITYSELKEGQERWSTLVTASPYNQWMYGNLIKRDELMRESRSIGWFTFLLCMVILFLSITLSMLGSRRMYQPIRTVYRKALGGDPAIERGAGRALDELQLIGEGIEKLQRLRMQLSEQLNSQSQQMRELSIQRLLEGGARPREIAEKMIHYQYASGDPRKPTLRWRWLCVFAVQIDTVEGTRYNKGDIDLLGFAIKNIISELISENERMEPVTLGAHQVTVVGGQSADSKLFLQQAKESLITIRRTIEELLQLPVSIGVSKPFGEALQMPEAYRESLAALKERLRVAQSDVFSASDLAVAPMIRATYPQWIEDELTEAVRSGEQEQAGRWLQRFLQEVFQEPLGEQEYRFVFIRLLAALLRELPNDTNPGTLFSASHPLDTELFALRTADELETWFQMRVIEPIMSVIEQYREPQRKSIAERVKMMIDEEYDQDLSLEICAARLHYHPGYVKTSFRKEMGMSFSECLALKRLTMAKRWLIETNMLISEIADRLRYNNPQNFIRAFRKAEDMTPGQYREQRREFPTS